MPARNPASRALECSSSADSMELPGLRILARLDDHHDSHHSLLSGHTTIHAGQNRPRRPLMSRAHVNAGGARTLLGLARVPGGSMLRTSEGPVSHPFIRKHWLLLAALPALSSCGGDDCYHCGYAPVYTPSEVSLGLVAGNFNGNGHASVIATSVVQYYSQGNTGYLKSYLSTGAGSF